MDQIDKQILRILQNNAAISQRDLADEVGLSQNACWRRMKQLKEEGLIKDQRYGLDPSKIDLSLTVFVLIKSRQHSQDWLVNFRQKTLLIENVIDFYRIAGDYDYLLKVVAKDMMHFDEVYQRLIKDTGLETVTSFITMEAIADNRPLPI